MRGAMLTLREDVVPQSDLNAREARAWQPGIY
jgi:hypothetical protein